MGILLVFLILFTALSAASVLGRTVDSRDAQYDLGCVTHPHGASS